MPAIADANPYPPLFQYTTLTYNKLFPYLPDITRQSRFCPAAAC